MGAMGKLLKNKRAGDEGLAWHAPNLAGASTLRLSSPDFEHEATIPTPHAGKRLGGQDLSPALDWDAAPPETAQLLLVIEDPDAPTALPYNHGIALLDATLTGVPRGGLDAETPADGVWLLSSGSRRGCLGPAPIKGHGPHRYVFQLFALGKPLTVGKSDTVPASARPRAVLAAAGDVLARGRLDGFYERV